MSGKGPSAPSNRVSIITPDGKFDTIGAEFADEVVAAGGRVLSKQEEAQRAVDERYAKLPLAQKALGVASLASPLAAPFAKDAPPALETYRQGVAQAFTGGLREVATKQAIGALSGDAAAKDYVRQLDEQRLASPELYTAGEIAGFTGAALAGRGGGVGGAIAKLGGAAERGAGAIVRAAIGEAPGIVGRAVTTAAELGARGAAEGAAIKATETASDALLHDHDLASDKLFSALGTGALYGGATGAVLGAGGSLLASGLRSGASRLLARGAEPAAEVASSEASAAAPAALPMKRWASGLAVDALGATKVQMRDALEYVAADLPAAREAAGEYLNRAIVGRSPSLMKAFMNGRADDLLVAIQADKAGRIADGLRESLNASPARVSVRDTAEIVANIYEGMLKSPSKIAGAEPFFKRVTTELDALKNAGKIAPDGTVDALDAYFARSEMAKQAYELKNVSGAAGDAYKTFLREWDGATIRALDDAGTKAGKNGVGDAIRYWKREYQLASAVEEMAEGGAERIAGNNAIGLREGIAGATALMTGHPVLGIVGPIALKLAKERGKATAAYALNQAAERGVLSSLVGKQNSLIDRASKGLITLPEKGAAKASEAMPPPRGLATKALARVAAFQADPEAFVDHVTRETEPIEAHSPEIATGIIQRQVRAMTFLSSKIPPGNDPDPLDPHKPLNMTPSQEAELARYAWYTEKPERFFAEVARGKLTPEGAEVAQALTPRAFAQLQQTTAEALATQLARGNRLPFRQRELLGQLLDFAATPAQRPEHRSFLQQNVSDVLPSNERIATAGPKGPRRISSQNGSALDRLEGKGPGRR